MLPVGFAVADALAPGDCVGVPVAPPQAASTADRPASFKNSRRSMTRSLILPLLHGAMPCANRRESRLFAMFTGIVKDVGTVERIAPRLRVETSLAGRLEVDDSVNVSGVCLTVVARDGKGFECDVVEETRRRSTLGAVRPGSRVNLEAAATPETSLGGHFVQGHVDGTSALVARSV